MKAHTIELVISGKTEGEINAMCQEIKEHYKPKRIMYHQCEWFER